MYSVRKLIPCWIGILLLLIQACDILGEDEMAIPSLDQINQSIEKQYSTLPDAPVLIDLTARIQTTSSLTLKLKEQPKKGIVTLMQQGILQYVPNASFTEGKDAIIYQITSQNEAILEDSITIIVAPDSTDLPCPSVLPNHYDVAMNTTTYMWVLFDDLFCTDNTMGIDTTSLTIAQSPQHGVARVQDQTIAYTPESGYEGSDQLVYQVCSAEDTDLCKMALVSIFVRSDCNYAQTDYQHLDVGTSYTIDVLANDELCISKENITLHIETPLPPEITATVTQDKQIQLLLSTEVQDSLAIKYTICDPHQQCSEAFIFVHSNPTDSTGTNPGTCYFDLKDDRVTLDTDTLNQYHLDVFTNDVICWEQDFTLELSQSPVHGSLQIEDNQLIYQPNDKAFRGYDSLYYQLCPTALPDTSCQQAKVIVELK